jgi:hypothetical protein
MKKLVITIECPDAEAANIIARAREFIGIYATHLGVSQQDVEVHNIPGKSHLCPVCSGILEVDVEYMQEHYGDSGRAADEEVMYWCPECEEGGTFDDFVYTAEKLREGHGDPPGFGDLPYAPGTDSYNDAFLGAGDEYAVEDAWDEQA